MKLIATVPLEGINLASLSDVYEGFILVISQNTLKIYKQVR